MTPRQYRVTRDVPKDEPYNWAHRDVKAGEIFEAFTGPTYGSCDEEHGIVLTGEQGAFFEFPLDAVESFP